MDKIMGEVKFRVWDGKSMIVEDVVYLGSAGFAIQRDSMDWDFDFAKFGDPDFIGMQYTGVKDKNGVEAFEGDWVSPCHGNYVTGEIIKWKGAFWVSGKDKSGCSGRDLLAHYPKFTIETNIYQTPELKGEK